MAGRGARIGHGRPIYQLQMRQVHATREFDQGGGGDVRKVYEGRCLSYGEP